MKTFKDLTKDQQRTALNKVIMLLASHIAEGIITIQIDDKKGSAELKKILKSVYETDNLETVKRDLLRGYMRKYLMVISVKAARGATYDKDGIIII